jgi:hypothetical protein
MTPTGRKETQNDQNRAQTFPTLTPF